jgi:uncharacterized protein (TIGR02687 family)
MSSSISGSLLKLFDKNRIVLWYDAKKELRADYESLNLDRVEKIEINNNEFSVKHRILREEPKGKFLLYHEGPQPQDLDNWLLDILLVHGQFRTDQISLWLSELGLGEEFYKVAQDHVEFFGAVKRRDALKKLLKDKNTFESVKMSMLAVCSSSEPRIDAVLENLLAELADEQDEKLKLLNRCDLADFLWDQLKRYYGYESKSLGLQDFAISLFKECYSKALGENYVMMPDAEVFLRRWKDSRRHYSSFEKLSNQYADILNIEQDLKQREIKQIMALDYFRLIDQRILSELVGNVVDKTISEPEFESLIRSRKESYWYKTFQNEYEAVKHGFRLMGLLDKTDFNVDSIDDGIRRYSKNWFKLDQHYRKFIYHFQSSRQISLLEKLNEQVENQYVNNFLLKVNKNWQKVVDQCVRWKTVSFDLQSKFYSECVAPFINNNKKVFVIISDALRYETGEELLGLIRQEDRYEAQIEPLLSMIPSSTQLGMASLLPNASLEFTFDDSGTVSVDNISSQGTSNRSKILEKAIPDRATAVKADDLLGMNRDTSRELLKDNDVIYIYHNRIDAVGDKKDSEERVFEAVEKTFEDLVNIVKKLANANANNMIITADHGFIYQNRPIEDSDFSVADSDGDEILYRDRRFILGKGLHANAGLKFFTSEQVGLSGEMEIQIPKSINRLRLKGSGSRYVHGGASLQEIVLPVIKINKKRQSDISIVDVDILKGSSSVITSGQLSVSFYQVQPVDNKIQPRKLRAGIYTQSGELVSDSHEIVFNIKSKNPRDREIKRRFILAKNAEQANNQEVILKLEEELTGTSHYKEFKSIRYMLRRSFTSDFDF